MNFAKLKNYLKVLRRDVINGYSDNRRALKSKLNKQLLDKQQSNVTKLESSMYHYNEILRIYADLAKQMKLDNSLEICIFFTYLLWNGYFSVTKENFYNSNNLASINGAYGFDIMTGKGVCLNFSTMLRDFLIACGYSAANLLNIADSTKKMNYSLPIKRKYVKSKSTNKDNFYSFVNKIKIRKYGNHVFTLIKEGKYVYAYDPTNLLLLNIKNINMAKLVNGTGNFKLKPYISKGNNLPKESSKLLNRFYNMSRFENPYSEEYFKQLADDLIKHLDINKKHLDNCYKLALGHIEAVSVTVEEYKSKKTK